MEAIKGFGTGVCQIFIGIVFLAFAIIGLVFSRDGGAKHGDRCFDCEEGRFETIPEADYVSIQTLFGKEELQCTHCESRNTKGILW